MLRSLRLHHFKGFEDYSVSFQHTSLVVGPNNAGKSTIIAALRSASLMLRHSLRRRPQVLETGSGHMWVYPIEIGQFDVEEENLRHEFREEETSFELRFNSPSGYRLTAIWPTDGSGYFYIRPPSGSQQPQNPNQVRRLFSPFITFPVLTPVEFEEKHLDPQYVKASLGGRLTSRHFRNQLWLLSRMDLVARDDRDLDGYQAHLREWAGEIELEQPTLDFGTNSLDLFYEEARGTPKEIVWAGDGLQVWLQILLYTYLYQDSACLVLDEPDIYLHPDLQRRLFRLLESLEGQTILATHSAEMVAEAPQDAIVWIDRSKRHAVSGPQSEELTELGRTIGSQFNLRLAKVLRSRVAVFVEGEDMTLIRHLARTVGAERLAREEATAIVPIGGFDNWRRVEGFKWLAERLLKGAIEGHVLLDRDYHSDAALEATRTSLLEAGLHPHIWERKEIENYLINPSAISRVSGGPPDFVQGLIAEETGRFYERVLFRRAEAREAEQGRGRMSLTALLEREKDELEKAWQDTDVRVALCSGKDLLSALNGRLQDSGFKAVSPRRLSKELTLGEIPDEATRVFLGIEESLAE